MHYAVTGRIRYDDEDSCLLIEAPSMPAAIDIFHERLREIREVDEDDEERDIIVNFVLSSGSEMKVEAGPDR